MIGSYTDKAELYFRDASGQILASLTIHSDSFGSGANNKTILVIPPSDADSIGEESVQLLEDSRYQFKLIRLGPAAIEIIQDGRIISINPSDPSTGRIDTRSQAGVLELSVRGAGQNTELYSSAFVGIRPVKFDLDEFRAMLDNVAQHSLTLLLSLGPHAQVQLKTVPSRDTAEVQQQFAFLRSLIDSTNFNRAIKIILANPHSRLQEIHYREPTNRALKPSRMLIRQFASGQPRVSIPEKHPLSSKLQSLPQKVEILRHKESSDTAENRFVKFTLEVYRSFTSEIETLAKAQKGSKYRWLALEASRLQKRFDNILLQPLFREVSTATVIPLSSPVLQGRQGYREMLRTWIRFYEVATLVWAGGEDVFSSGKKGTDKLYEYWLLFQLLDLFQRRFDMPFNKVEKLFKISNNSIELTIRSGSPLEFRWTLNRPDQRRLWMQFSYNRTFSYTSDAKQAGSWSRAMRPDFTLSWWPADFSIEEAESQELIVHVHLDSKYRIDSIRDIFGEDDENIEDIRSKEKKGDFKRGDLHKMHTYRDAIRRSAGAYVLYPGQSAGKYAVFRGFHEILPGIGAFAVRPDSDGAAQGIDNIDLFLNEILQHLNNRISAREQMDYERYRIYSPVTVGKVSASVPNLSNLPERFTASGDRLRPPLDDKMLLYTVESAEESDWISSKSILPVMVTDPNGTPTIVDPFSIQWALLIQRSGPGPGPFLKIPTKPLEFVSGRFLSRTGYTGDTTLEAIYALIGFSETNSFSFQIFDSSALDSIVEDMKAKSIKFSVFLMKEIAEKLSSQ